jgi:ABC-2 type transport system ATP-binding protein
VIEISGLVKRYGGRSVLAGVDLVVRPGELVALLGPNGAGKTTTVEIIEGYRRPDGGRVRVLGEDPASGGPALRARVGLMLQGGIGLEPRATPRDLVRLYAAFHLDAGDPNAILDTVGLAAVAGTRVRRLSGGERQRLALAIALVGEPEVLILDEPTAGMDPEAKRETRSRIAALRRQGRTILLTTHDLGDVERLADRVAILHRGRIVASGTPAELTSAGGDAVRFRTRDVPSPAALATLGRRLRSLAAAATVEPDRDLFDGDAHDGRAFRVAGAPPARAIADVAGWAVREGLLLVELRAGSATLEERYFELTADRDVEAVA